MLQHYAEEKHFECCGIELTQYKIILICIYRTPNRFPHFFLNKLELLLTKLRTKLNKNIIICGDFNINVLKDNSVTQELNRILHNYNLLNHISVPTRNDACLDLILSNIPNAKEEVLPFLFLIIKCVKH